MMISPDIFDVSSENNPTSPKEIETIDKVEILDDDDSKNQSSEGVVDSSISFVNRKKKKVNVIESDTDEEDAAEISCDLKSSNYSFFQSGLRLRSTSIFMLKNSETSDKENVLSSSRESIDNFSSEDDVIIDISSDDENCFIPESPKETPIKKSECSLLHDKINENIIESYEKPHLGAIPKSVLTSTEIKHQTETNIDDSIEVSPQKYQDQGRKVESLQEELAKTEKAIRSVSVNALPDKGVLLKNRHGSILKNLREQRAIFRKMKLKKEEACEWKNIEVGIAAVQPKTFGGKGLEKYNTEKALTIDRLQQLHTALKTCPGNKDFADAPKHLTVELMPHQKTGLAWLLWRETQKPSGGILADDMGLGKTLTLISLILKWKEKDEINDGGGALVVCPASLVHQWEGEIKKHVRRNTLSVILYYGKDRETNTKRLARQNVVITTYGLIKNDKDKGGPLFKIRWRHIILDEAHQIRNHKTQTSEAVCELSAKSRWVLTGTPVHNKQLDLYSLLKFLRCSPFDDLRVWKMWIDKKTDGGDQRLHTVISSLLLRRTKEQLQQSGSLVSLPEKQWELITVNFEKEELNVYQKVLLFSKALFSQFLQQKAEKNTELKSEKFGDNLGSPNEEYVKVHKLLKRQLNLKEVKQSDILVLLLRLRQICCHPSLILGMLAEQNELDGFDEEQRIEEMNILEQMKNLDLNSDKEHENPELGTGEEVNLAEAAKKILNPSNPVFSKERISSKEGAILKCLKNILSLREKAIVVSQWSSLLSLIGNHLKISRIKFQQFDGSLPMIKRQEIVESFNDPNGNIEVLLLSLTAGGVGLNLVGANHLILADLHWNPQLELQAQDRIYRVGQKKMVHIYKFMIADSIEERVKFLQDKKLEISEEVLTGSRTTGNKLSMNDLKMLFQV